MKSQTVSPLEKPDNLSLKIAVDLCSAKLTNNFQLFIKRGFIWNNMSMNLFQVICHTKLRKIEKFVSCI